MTKYRKALGRGIQALIPEAEVEIKNENVSEIAVDKIDPNPFQPRKEFAQEKIEELAVSIKENGLCQPILVKKDAGRYILINGERRLRAFKALGYDMIPALFRDVTENEMMSLALIENIQREELNEIEEARGYEELLARCGLSHEEIARKVGKSRSTITNFLRLLKLPAFVQEQLVSKKISMGHARALLAFEDGKRMESLCREIIQKGYSVRQVEELLRGPDGAGKKLKKPARAQPVDPHIQSIKEQLEYIFGTQVRINEKKGKGKIEIDYFSGDDLTRICDILLK